MHHSLRVLWGALQGWREWRSVVVGRWLAPETRQRPRRVLAHKWLVVVERAREQLDVLGNADIADDDGRVPLQAPHLGSLHGRTPNAALDSSCDIASNAHATVRASLDASTGRCANSGTASACANFTFHGHASWEERRYDRFAVSLSTGVGTPKTGAVYDGSAQVACSLRPSRLAPR